LSERNMEKKSLSFDIDALKAKITSLEKEFDINANEDFHKYHNHGLLDTITEQNSKSDIIKAEEFKSSVRSILNIRLWKVTKDHCQCKMRFL
jgi:hypothetical protein